MTVKELAAELQKCSEQDAQVVWWHAEQAVMIPVINVETIGVIPQGDGGYRDARKGETHIWAVLL